MLSNRRLALHQASGNRVNVTMQDCRTKIEEKTTRTAAPLNVPTHLTSPMIANDAQEWAPFVERFRRHHAWRTEIFVEMILRDAARPAHDHHDCHLKESSIAARRIELRTNRGFLRDVCLFLGGPGRRSR
jgi:hypothetical protein